MQRTYPATAVLASVLAMATGALLCLQLARIQTLPMPFPDIVSIPVELVVYLAFMAAIEPRLKWWALGLAILGLIGMRFAISSGAALALQVQHGQGFAHWFQQLESSLAVRGVALGFVIVSSLPFRGLFIVEEETNLPAAPQAAGASQKAVEEAVKAGEPGQAEQAPDRQDKLFEGVALPGTFSIPAQDLVSCIPPEYLGNEAQKLASAGADVELPLSLITAELPRGRLAFALARLKDSLPRGFLSEAPDDVFVDLPLDIVVGHLPKGAFVAPEWPAPGWLKLFVDSGLTLFSPPTGA
jgi:hypothetical protein